MEGVFSVVVEGGRPWGFTLQGGLEFRAPLRVGKVTPGGKAEKAGLISGDYITKLNNTEVKGLKHLDAKQFIIASTSTLQLSCTKAPPVGLFSPPANKPAPQFSFTSSPTSLLPTGTMGTRPRSSSFTSPTSPTSLFPPTMRTRPRTSSFTSPSTTGTRSRTSSFTSPTHSRNSSLSSPSHVGSAAKASSLKKPPPPVIAMPPVTSMIGGRSHTLPSGRPKPPVTYHGDIGNSSSGVSSSVSSAPSSPPPPHIGGLTNIKGGPPHIEGGPPHVEGGPPQISPSHIHQPPPPPVTQPSPRPIDNGYGVGNEFSPHQAVVSCTASTNTAIDTGTNAVTDDTGNTNAVTDDTGNTNAVTDDTGNTNAVTDDTGNTNAVTDDAGNTNAVINSDTANMISTDSRDDSTIPDTADIANTVVDTMIADPADTTSTINDAVDTADIATDSADNIATIDEPVDDITNAPTDIVNAGIDPVDTVNTVTHPADSTNVTDTTDTSTVPVDASESDAATDAVDTTDTATTPIDTTDTADNVVDTTDTATAPIDTTGTATNVVDTTGTATNVVDTTDTAANVVDTTDTATNAIDTATNVVDTTGTATNVVDTTGTATNVVDTTDTATNAVDTATNVVDTTDTAANAVDTTDTATNAVDTTGTATNVVDTTDTATNAVDTATNVVDTTDTAANAVDTTDTATNAVDTTDTASNAVDTTNMDAEPEMNLTSTQLPVETDTAPGSEEVKGEMERDEETAMEVGVSDTVANDQQKSELNAEATPTDEEQHQEMDSIDKQIEDARRAREAELKARAQSLLTGKLGSLVRSKPPLPPSASVPKPPLPPTTRPPRSPTTTKSPHQSPISPSGAPMRKDINESKRGGDPVIKPYLVKKGEDTPNTQASLPDRTMSDIKMAYRMPGWYREMFQGFQQTVEELFPDHDTSNHLAPTKNVQHARTKSSPADVETYVYDHRGLKVRKSSLTDSTHSSPVRKIRPSSAHISSTDVSDPVYVYDHRGLRVKKESLSSSDIVEPETTPTIVVDSQEEVTTADVLAASCREYSMDSGYDERGLRLRGDSQGNGDMEDELGTGLTGEDGDGAVEVTKDDVIDSVKKSTSYKSDKFTTEPSRNYWSTIDQQFAVDQKKKREVEEQQEKARAQRDDSSSDKMAHMHPLLTEGLEDVPTPKPAGEVFDRIDAEKLHGALENAKTLGTMEQEGVPSTMLPLQQRERKSQEPEKLPPPGKKARALFAFEGQSEKELSFQKAAIIDLLHTVNESWLEGMIGQTKGIFPSSYVQVLSHEELRELLAAENAPLMQATASYDFDPQNDGELQFKKGDNIVITKKIDDNWYQGYLGDRKGIFPSSYVEVLDDTH